MQPFDPPDDPLPTREPDALMPVVVWALSGACVGVGAGFTADMMGAESGAIALSVGGLLLGAACGWGAHRLDRVWARAGLLDGSGRVTRPLGTWVLAVPVAIGVVGLLWLVVIGTIRAESRLAGLAYLFVAIGVASLFRPLAARELLSRAVAAADSGRDHEAVARFTPLSRGWWAPRQVRAMARLNLGLLSLRAGDLLQAEQWYAAVDHPRARAFGRTGLALSQVLQGQFAAAEASLQGAFGDRNAQGEVDGVRLLLVLRRDGPADAHELGERLLAPGVGSLFLGVLAAARSAQGDEAGAAALVSDDLRRALAVSGLDQLVEEVAAVLG